MWEREGAWLGNSEAKCQASRAASSYPSLLFFFFFFFLLSVMQSSGDFPSNDSVTVWKSLPFQAFFSQICRSFPQIMVRSTLLVCSVASAAGTPTSFFFVFHSNHIRVYVYSVRRSTSPVLSMLFPSESHMVGK